MNQEQAIDIFETYNSLKTVEERVSYLKQMCSKYESIKKLLKYAYDDRIKLKMKTPPKHRKENFDRGLGYKSIHKYHRLFEHFLISSTISEKRSLEILENLLSDLQWEDAELVKQALFARKLPYKNLTKKFVKEHFPEIFK